MPDDFGDKTHEATPYRRQKAREEGQVVRSQDLASAGLLIAGLLVLWYFSRGLAELLGRMTADHLGGDAWLSIDAPSAVAVKQETLGEIFRGLWKVWRTPGLLPVLALLLLGAILAHLGQFGFLYLPVVILIIFSFNDTRSIAVFTGFSTEWYTSLAANDELLDAARNSLLVGLITTIASTTWPASGSCC